MINMSSTYTNGNLLMAKSDGKTSLFSHLLDCWKVTRFIVENSPLASRESLLKDAEICAITHDVGKAAKGFQEVLMGKKKNWKGKRHEIISAAFLSHLPNIKEEQIMAVITHHRTIPDPIEMHKKKLPPEQICTIEDEYTGCPSQFQKMLMEFLENREEFLKCWNKICNITDNQNLSIKDLPEIKNIQIDGRWLESDRYGQKAIASPEQRKYASVLRGILMSADHIASASYVKPEDLPKPIIASEISIFKKNEQPFPFQERMRNIRGNAILQAPTGSGKTKAALNWVMSNQRQNGRIFYALPYTASINAMHETLKKIYGAENIGLLHYKNAEHIYTMLENDIDSKSKDEMAREVASLSREIFYPIKTCTPHQILRFMLMGKGWEQALIEFPEGCFIFDEIHAYEPKILGLLLASVKWINRMGGKCLFLSATFPKFIVELLKENLSIPDENILSPNPHLKRDKEILNKKRHILEVKEGTILDVLNSDKRFEDSGVRKLIICNNIRTSQMVYDIMIERFGKEDVVLLHSKFAQKDRDLIEKSILNNQPTNLVATQVIEVSLNIDYEIGLTEPAPIDALIQRFGRVNRYGHRAPEPVIVATKQVNKYEIYPEEITEKTLRELKKFFTNSVLSETDLVDVSNVIYSEGFTGKRKTEFEKALSNEFLLNFEDNIIVGSYRDWIDDIIEEMDFRKDVLPSCYLGEYRKLISEKRWIEADMLLVPIRIGEFKRLMELGYIEEKSLDNPKKNVFVVTSPYDQKRGLTTIGLKKKNYGVVY